jgi:Flp pilus assembly CpaE family ATPase
MRRELRRREAESRIGTPLASTGIVQDSHISERTDSVARLSFLVFSEREDSANRICGQLRASEHAQVTEVVSERARLGERIRSRTPDVLLVDLGERSEELLECVGSIDPPRPPLVVLGPRDDADLLLRAMQVGAKECLPANAPDESVSGLVERLFAEYGPAVHSRKKAAIVAVMGAKGGVGASVVACQLAIALQELGGRTAIVDLNLPLGDVAMYLNLQPDYTIADVARGDDRLDAAFLEKALAAHGSGVNVLAAPGRLEDAKLIRPSHVDRTLGLLAGSHDWIVVDVSREWKETAIRALDVADEILLVGLPDVPTLNQARKHLDLLRRLGRKEESIHLVSNRDGAAASVSVQDAKRFLGREPEARIPNDFDTCVTATNEGLAASKVAPDSRLTAAFASLARRVYAWRGEQQPEASDPDSLGSRVRRVLQKAAAPPPRASRRVDFDQRKRPFQVITVASNKGGVGKTTVATNLAVYLRALREDLPILVLELDDQTMPDRMFGLDSTPPGETIATALRAGSFASAVRLGQYGVHYVPSAGNISELKREIPDPFFLQSVLMRTGWKGLVIIDTKSDLEVLTQNALAASDLSLIVVQDQTSLHQAEKIFRLLDRWRIPRERSRILLSLVDRRIKYRDNDVLGFLVSQIREHGYPLFEAFLSRSPAIESLYTNPEGRAYSILHRATRSLVHRQMTHLANDVLKVLDEIQATPFERAVPEEQRVLTPRRWRQYARGARVWASGDRAS